MKVNFRVTKDTGNKNLEKLRKQLKNSGKVVQVGFPDSEIHEGGQSVAFIASVHEYGAPSAGVPERPFLKPSIIQGKKDQLRLNKINLVKILHNQIDFDTALGQLGEMAKGQVQLYIVNGHFVPLKPRTVARKGSSKPLIYTGQMRQSVAWEIEDA
jgi:hypothetical protein